MSREPLASNWLPCHSKSALQWLRVLATHLSTNTPERTCLFERLFLGDEWNVCAHCINTRREPVSYRGMMVRRPCTVVDEYLASCGRDFLDGAHKDVCDNGHTREAVEEAEQIEKCPHLDWPSEFADQRQQQCVRARVVIQCPIISRHFLSQALPWFSTVSESNENKIRMK